MKSNKQLLDSLDGEIHLDQITILIEAIQNFFVNHFDPNIDINNWDPDRIRDEISQLVPIEEFPRLLATDFGKGVLVGMWAQAFLLGQDMEQLDELEEEIKKMTGQGQ